MDRARVVGAIIAVAVTIVLVLALPSLGTLRWIGFDPWGIAGNVFSNFYEDSFFAASSLRD